jgi:Domain of unknown function (DUF4389)
MAAANPPAGPSPLHYPVHVQADPQPAATSRWLWLVKWLLALPHYVVLAFLWVAFMVLSLVALVAILVTGRYPRAIFDFNVGVLRWSWRVAYYSYGALATDRYPPFSLAEDPTYPAHFDVEYPEHLSRGLVLVKWWLLAIPQYIVVGVFLGSGTWVVRQGGEWQTVWGGGLVGILVLVAAVLLAVTGSYPRPVYDLLLGVNRWVLRVAAYAGLMTDEYPPFRLDMGGADPDAALLLPASPGGDPAVASPPVAPAVDSPAAAPSPADAPGPADAQGSAGAPGEMPSDPPSDPPPAPPPPPAGAPALRAADQAVPGPPHHHRGWTAGRSVSVVVGSVLALVALAVLIGGAALLVANRTMRDDGFLSSGSQQLSSSGYAIVVGDVALDGPGADTSMPARVIGDVRVRVTPRDAATPVFVGIGPAAEVDAYLSGVARTVPDASGQGQDIAGSAPSAPPQAVDVWQAQSAGPGARELFWTPRSGHWSMVLMNQDGTGPVTASIDVGVAAPWLPWLGGLFLAAGVVVMVAAIVLVAVAVHRASR